MRCWALSIFVLIVLIGHVSVAAAEDSKEKAKVHFEKGVELFQNGDHDAALVEFKAAYEAQPHFAVRYNIGICLYKLHRYGEANLELGAYLAEGGEDIPAAKKDEVETIMNDLDQLLGTLKVDCSVEDATLLIDGKPFTSWLVRIEVGEHEVEVTSKGYEDFKTIVDVPGGEIIQVDAQLVPAELKDEPAPGKPVSKSAFWTMFVLTSAFVVAASITGGVALGKDKEYKKLAYEDVTWRDIREAGRRLTITADVLWGMTAAAGLTTLILAFFTDFKKEKVAVSVSPMPSTLSMLVEVKF